MSVVAWKNSERHLCRSSILSATSHSRYTAISIICCKKKKLHDLNVMAFSIFSFSFVTPIPPPLIRNLQNISQLASMNYDLITKHNEDPLQASKS
jgi:hypothetical protein